MILHKYMKKKTLVSIFTTFDIIKSERLCDVPAKKTEQLAQEKCFRALTTKLTRQ
jgi:hypothetical protein